MIGTTQEVEISQFMNQVSKLPTIIVPARLESQRFPRKLLAEVKGKPILWTAERIREIVPEFDLYFAVDGEELAELLENSGFSIVMTDPELPSGTDRIAAANREIQANLILNIQGDEPLVERSHILALVSGLELDKASMSTVAVPFSSEKDFLDPNQVKVLCDQLGYALYFSRSPIPYNRNDSSLWENKQANLPLKHLGMYGYNADFLGRFLTFPEGKLEKVEKLEQLRALENGEKIAVSTVDSKPMVLTYPKILSDSKSSSNPNEFDFSRINYSKIFF